MKDKKFITLGVAFAVLIVVLLTFINSTFITINSGERGVIFRKFGGGLDKENVYNQGFHIVAPWNEMIVYDTREQLREETMDVLSSNGLPISVDISTRFKAKQDQIGYLHDEIGEGYADKIVRDVVRTTAREIIGKYTPEELYSIKRDTIKQEIVYLVSTELDDKYIKLESVNIRNIKLPATLEDAIAQKLVQEQEKEQYEFRIEKESREAERKEIEAEGIRAFQEIVSQGISADYLRWKGIEATQVLANSPNSKVVIIGSAKDGLPLILGD